MDKVLARYFVKLIAENLQFSFNGMGIPSYSCEWLENQLIQGNFDKVEEFIKLRYAEQNKKRIKKKHKHKFRAITYGDICSKWKEIHTFCRKDEVKCPFLVLLIAYREILRQSLTKQKTENTYLLR